MIKKHNVSIFLILFLSFTTISAQIQEIDLANPGDEIDVLLYGAATNGIGVSGMISGDFNDDNIDDLFIASQWVATGSANDRVNGGEGHIIFGSTDLGGVLDVLGTEGSTPDVVIFGAETNGQLTRNGAWNKGDVNGDGVDDLVLAAPPASGGASDVFVIYGSSSLSGDIDLLTNADVHISGPSGFSHVGLEALVATGDINNDNKDDILLGSPFTESVYIIYGSDNLPISIDINNSEQDVTILAKSGSAFGSAALEVGDVNDDQIGDIILGTPVANEVFIIYGSATLPSTIDLDNGGEDVHITGATSGDGLGGGGVFKLGDFNDDAIVDVLLTAPGADGPSDARSGAGEAYVVFGSSSLPATISLSNGEEDVLIYGADGGDNLGDTNASAVGDINGDNIDDIIIGAWRGRGSSNSLERAGEVYVILGSSTLSGTIDLNNGDEDTVIYGRSSKNDLSRGGIVTGDINNDGKDDLIMPAFASKSINDSRTQVTGELHVVYGSNSLASTVDLANDEGDIVLYGATNGDEFSATVSLRHPSIAVGDWNDDGTPDFASSAWKADGPSEGRGNAGEVYLFLSTPPCSCSPICSPLPTADATYTATTSVTDADGYTHYCDGSGNLLLSVKIPAGGAIPVGAVSLKIGSSSTSFLSEYCGGAIQACPVANPNGAPVLNRQWNIDNTQVSGVSGLVNIVHYFTNQELADLQTSATNNGSTALGGATDLQLYKVNDFGGAFGIFPELQNVGYFDVTIIRNAVSPGTTFWSLTTYSGATGGVGAEFQVFTLLGGGAVAGKLHNP